MVYKARKPSRFPSPKRGVTTETQRVAAPHLVFLTHSWKLLSITRMTCTRNFLLVLKRQNGVLCQAFACVSWFQRSFPIRISASANSAGEKRWASQKSWAQHL